MFCRLQGVHLKYLLTAGLVAFLGCHPLAYADDMDPQKVLSEPQVERIGVSEETPIEELLDLNLESVPQSKNLEFGVSPLRFSMSLLAVLFLMIICFYCVRMVKDRNLKDAKGHRIVEIVERLYLGPKRSIILVRVGGKVMALGLDDRINFLTLLDDEKSLEMIDSADMRRQRKFAKVLSHSHRHIDKKIQELSNIEAG